MLIRLDLNVPLSKEDGTTITDDTRLRAVVPTMKFLRDAGARVVVATHVGRPKGASDPAFSVAPIVGRFSELLDTDVVKADDCVGADAKSACDSGADVVLLENVRFHAGETKNDAAFAEALARDSGATAYVNDAFGTAHRRRARVPRRRERERDRSSCAAQARTRRRRASSTTSTAPRPAGSSWRRSWCTSRARSTSRSGL